MNQESFVRNSHSPLSVAVLALLGLAAVHPLVPACAAESDVYSFIAPNGAQPDFLLRSGDGSLYGTTAHGGTSSAGTVFRVASNGQLQTLYSFAGGADGDTPISLTAGSDGNFYGRTSAGGAHGNGTVFRLTPQGVKTTLYSFTAVGDGDGVSLVEGADHNFYGTGNPNQYANDGAPDCVVFQISPGGVENTIYVFPATPGAQNNSTAVSSLALGADGQLYGTSAGTLFRLTAAGLLTTLNPSVGGLLLINGSSGDGNLYGSEPYGALYNDGSVDRVSLQGVVTDLHDFNYSLDGSNPTQVIYGGDGNLYGVVLYTGGNLYGNLFKVSYQGVAAILYSFTGGADGSADATVALAMGADGNIHGESLPPSPSVNLGTLFEVNPGAGTYSAQYSFAPKGGFAPQSLIQASDGNFYGTASGGLFNHGMVIRVSPTGQRTILNAFAGSTHGSLPYGLLQGADGNFYGVAGSGGANGFGTVFRMTPAGFLQTVYSFAQVGGSDVSAFIQASDGNFYGTQNAPGNGTVFKLTPQGVFTVLHAFSGQADDGGVPSSLIQGADGNLYGTTTAMLYPTEGTTFSGTVFRITTQGDLTTLYEAPWDPCCGGYTPTTIIQGSDGNFYGSATASSVRDTSGVLFQMTPTGNFTGLFYFSPGADVPLQLLQASDGNFYGTTLTPQILEQPFFSSGGSVFELSPDGNFTTLYAFAPWNIYQQLTPPDTVIPSRLIEGSDGNLYGTTFNESAVGSVFEVSLH